MDVREVWERNATLAEAFCQAEERVAMAQRSLDFEQETRARLLAAMAVTVGSDGAVAGFLGVGERSVRSARRTVGRAQGRETAEQLFAQASGGNGPGSATAETIQSYPGDEQQAGPLPPPDLTAVPDGMTPPPEPAPAASRAPWWTSSMDAVLVQGWWAGLDPQVLADQLGMDLRSVMLRVQQLSIPAAQAPPPAAAYPRTVADQDNAGRHRRAGESWGSYDCEAQVTYLPRQHAPGAYSA
ncbi:hypothetical protein [Streptomyces sp. H27-D2]|uniref:hypothetical protein n=1 Tax=Streptomyces sp. H27-D2 TaxID=3046304 RepID=UPI002DBEA4BF|nr:hypothetical protein [Streptomyces sp. H27-D2]MEC4015367.1 hypothetical protein [Streptomyces sp. H27-D2]